MLVSASLAHLRKDVLETYATPPGWRLVRLTVLFMFEALKVLVSEVE